MLMSTAPPTRQTPSFGVGIRYFSSMRQSVAMTSSAWAIVRRSIVRIRIASPALYAPQVPNRSLIDQLIRELEIA